MRLDGTAAELPVVAETEAVGAGVLVAVDLLVGVVGTADRLAVAEAVAVLAVALPVGVPLVAVPGAGTEELGVATGLVDVPELGGVVTEGLVCFASTVERKTGRPCPRYCTALACSTTVPLCPGRYRVYLASGHHARRTAALCSSRVPRWSPRGRQRTGCTSTSGWTPLTTPTRWRGRSPIAVPAISMLNGAACRGGLRRPLRQRVLRAAAARLTQSRNWRTRGLVRRRHPRGRQLPGSRGVRRERVPTVLGCTPIHPLT